MARYTYCVLTLLLAATAPHAQAENGAQSFESCSLITSEYLTVLQLLSRGFDRDSLKLALPGISPQAQNRIDALDRLIRSDGLTESYSRINSEFSRCAKQVYDRQGMPPRGTREAHFHYCAGENKVRYDILMAAVVGADLEEVAPQLATRYQQVAESLYGFYEQEGELAVFDSLASELKSCLNNRP